ncbi:MAG: acetylornithine deacetylase [Alphaproteobacteria bacterium]
MRSREILRELIAFPTISANPNRALIDYCAAQLQACGAVVEIIADEAQGKANLYATLGPADRPGVLLSGHTDVVPVEGQAWTKPPFELTEQDGKLFGRGTCDMKGFVASVLACAHEIDPSRLKTPLHVALSFDEEIGCVGVRSMLDMLKPAPFKPLFCIVGEPTMLQVATGHKGKLAARVTCRGVEGHSALAPKALNAIYLATDMVQAIRSLQTEIESEGASDVDYDVPYTTLHVGRIEGGTALNIVPNTCTFLFEIRNLAGEASEALFARLRSAADGIVARYQSAFPQAQIDMEVTNRYPALDTDPGAEVVKFVQALANQNATMKVAFGTEGGLFSETLGVPTVVCGPGSMDQGHKPDEFLSIEQLQRCDAMLARLAAALQDGL